MIGHIMLMGEVPVLHEVVHRS